MIKKGEYAKFRNFERKMKSPFMIYVDFETNIKNILLVVMVTNYYVLMINLVNLLNHT